MYVLSGKPISILKMREQQKRQQWDEQAAAKARLSFDLANQHADRPLYDGPLHITVAFYFQFLQPISREKLSQFKGIPHMINPGLTDLIQFVEWIGKGVLFAHDYIICGIDARKCFDDNPRTEITIKRLD